MENLSAFFSQNARPVKNIKYAASERFIGEDGQAVLWEIRAMTPAEDEAIRRDAMCRSVLTGRRTQASSELDYNLYLGKMAAECTVFPNLNSAELQASYGVMGADALLKVMLTPGEYSAYLIKVQEQNGFSSSFDDMVDDAKN